MAAPISVRVQALDGKWETLGVDRFAGIAPEKIVPVADQLGPSTASWQIQRDTGLIHPDLQAWTPCEIEVGGTIIWDGRIKETPTTKGAESMITVNAIGYQNHMQDDALERYYCHQDLTQWQDTRANPLADLTQWTSSPSITSGNGQVGISFPAGSDVPAGCYAGICLDLGLNTLAGSCYAALIASGTAGLGFTYFVRAAADVSGLSGSHADSNDSGTPVSALPGTPIVIGGRFTGFYRYVFIFLYNGTGSDVTIGATDCTIAVTRAIVSCNFYSYVSDGATGTAEDGGAYLSDLRASDVIIDKVGLTCPLITALPGSPKYSDEILGDFPLSYWTFGPEAIAQSGAYAGVAGAGDLGSLANDITAINAFSTVAAALGPGLLSDDTDTGLGPLNGTSQYAVAGGSAGYGGIPAITVECLFEATNPASGGTQSIFTLTNGTVAIAYLALDATGHLAFYAGTNGGGTNIHVVTTAALAAGTVYHCIAFYAPDGTMGILLNGAVQTVTPGGTGTGPITSGSFTAYIGVQPTLDYFAGTIDDVSVFPFVLTGGQRQNHYWAARARQHGGIQRTQFKIPHYAPSGSQTAQTDVTAVNALHNWRVKVPVGRDMIFQPQPTAARLKLAPTVDFSDSGANDGTVIYNKCIVEGQDATGVPIRQTLLASQVTNVPTMVDRRSFYRTMILTANAAIDQPTALLLATAFLTGSLTSPFRGSFIAATPTDVLLLPGETFVPPSELILFTGELVQVPVINPDTGDIGRDGKLVQVSYDTDAEAATCTVDDDRNNLQALMARMAVVQQAI